MKKHICVLIALFTSVALSTCPAQPGPRGRGMGGPPSGPQFGGDMGKIFGEHQAFSASLEFHMGSSNVAEETTMPGQIAYLEGKSRFEMNMAEMKNARLRPGAIEQMKQMGMDKMITLGRPDKKVSYLVYPGLQAYIESPQHDAESPRPESDYTLETTKLGKETVDGHVCIKHKVVSTDKDGKTHESTVWNATDLKDFPVRIDTTENDRPVTLLFKDVKFSRPEAAQFEPPADFTKHDNMMMLLRAQTMKRVGAENLTPPGR